MQTEKKEELITRGTAKVYFVNSHPFVYASLCDIKPGMGMIQVHSDWGYYCSFWAGMGDRTIAEFVTQMDAGYIQRNFRERMGYMGFKKCSEGRLAQFMIECWPRLREEIKKDFIDWECRGCGQINPTTEPKCPNCGVNQ